MKRVLALLLAAAVLFSLAACNNNSDSSEPSVAKQVKLPDAKGLKLPFYAADNGYMYRGVDEQTGELFYVKGVNMGLSEPAPISRPPIPPTIPSWTGSKR